MMMASRTHRRVNCDGAENARLISLLDAHGITWRETAPTVPQPASPSLTTDEKVALFSRLFRGRTDVYQSKAGKSGYSHRQRLACFDPLFELQVRKQPAFASHFGSPSAAGTAFQSPGWSPIRSPNLVENGWHSTTPEDRSPYRKSPVRQAFACGD
jgi:hypothetical protein